MNWNSESPRRRPTPGGVPDDQYRPRTEDGPVRESRRRRHPGPPGGGRGRGGAGRGGGTPHGSRRDERRARRARRDVRGAVLAMLVDEPMHGYQLMQAITERSNGLWRPSPGAIYPALAQLEDEGLVTISTVQGRKVASLTEEGRTAATTQDDPFTQDDHAAAGPDLRESVSALQVAAREVARSGSQAQREHAQRVIDDARRALYLVLAEPDVQDDAPSGPATER